MLTTLSGTAADEQAEGAAPASPPSTPPEPGQPNQQGTSAPSTPTEAAQEPLPHPPEDQLYRNEEELKEFLDECEKWIRDW